MNIQAIQEFLNTVFGISVSGIVLRIIAIAIVLFGCLLITIVTNRTIIPWYSRKRKLGKQAREYIIRAWSILMFFVAMYLVLRLSTIDYIFQSGDGKIKFAISSLALAGIVVCSFRVIRWLITQVFLRTYYSKYNVGIGAQFSFNQLVKYFLYVFAFFLAIQAMGLDVTLIWGAAAALLVGIGLGLQQTFNDILSGIIILFERPLKVGDIISVAGSAGIVTRVGYRTCELRTSDNKALVVPNSHITNNDLINWNFNDNIIRISIKVGVAYGTDTSLVKELLLQVVAEHPQVLEDPEPFVRFNDFGASSLDFEVYFWIKTKLDIGHTPSDLRFKIDEAFRKHSISIPFPQRDIWVRQNQLPTE